MTTWLMKSSIKVNPHFKQYFAINNCDPESNSAVPNYSRVCYIAITRLLCTGFIVLRKILIMNDGNKLLTMA